MDKRKSDLREELEALKKKAENAFGGRSIPSVGGDIFKPVMPEDIEQAVDEYVAPVASGPLEKLVSGRVEQSGAGPFYRVLAGAGEIWETAENVHEEYLSTIAGSLPDIKPELSGLIPVTQSRPEDICYLDIETTGLSNTPLFLIGLMYTKNGRLMIDQLFARDYTEERNVLVFLETILSGFKTLVTFNGIGFDIPFIAARMSSGRIPFSPPPVHVDLLKVARKGVGKRTPNHKLQTLEIFLLGRKRKGDIPGSRIPGAYRDFVRNGDAGNMATVIHHNRLDLYSMLELVTFFLSGR
ncbi:MAG: ribonuclease H-like domain-containing protein [Candidatus Krumholzibacteria bacterium]|nr:ribonuclease H-like domain-containing protein [Candidatus Krumholzibacteria bacterium]